jgi:hypothetical protein
LEVANPGARSIWDEYRLLGEQFRGPATVAWTAEHVISGRRARLTTVHAPPMASGVTAEAIAHAFRRAAEQARELAHPDHLPVIGIAEQSGLPVAVTMLGEGAPLSEQLAEAPMPLGEAMKRVSRIAHAVSALHTAGLRHGYLVPENLWVREDGRIALIDSGLHAAAAHAAYTSGFPLAACPYVAPADEAYAEANPGADVHSLVALLLRLVTGRVTPPEGLPVVVEALPDALPASLRAELREAVTTPRPATAPTARSLAVHLAFDTAWIRARERSEGEQHLLEGEVLEPMGVLESDARATSPRPAADPGIPRWGQARPAAGVRGGVAGASPAPDAPLPRARVGLARLTDAGRAAVDGLRRRVTGRTGPDARGESDATPLIASYAVRVGPFEDVKAASTARARLRRDWPLAAVVAEGDRHYVQIATCATRRRADELAEQLHGKGEAAEVSAL